MYESADGPRVALSKYEEASKPESGPASGPLPVAGVATAEVRHGEDDREESLLALMLSKCCYKRGKGELVTIEGDT